MIHSDSHTSDTACVDIFGTLSRAYLAPLTALLQDPSVADLAPEVTISYVGAAPAGSLLPLTAGMKIQLTHHFTDADVAPGRLDAVLVPGPDPREEWDPEALAWLAAHAAAEGTDILSVCTGIFVCGKAGLLRGRKACGPRTLQELLGKTFEGVELVGGEMRWVNDGNFWSCGEWSAPCSSRRHSLPRFCFAMCCNVNCVGVSW